jgi:nitrogen regulatory protein PII
MTLLKVITSPEFVDQVRDALVQAGIVGMTVTDVRGVSRGPQRRVHYRGAEVDVAYVPRTELQLVVADAHVRDAVNEIMEVTRHDTTPGESRLFVIPVERAYRIRTGEIDAEEDFLWV